ncbi:4-hydroxythreonine-4-phosphate dehydrogenase [Glycocaulis alkaliphilus]|uniref:4-hydroxythreonine-4-phosphate dehydrogenase n=1 Tax=Glycocaulis alkaliphilus TaxID=1434191 RepID=A0A3T0E7K7_9PROT|nr:4-hydroxythreonine-4-phosphate dehydrogenase PdxA [Glycocaulis alkaliphilus]AZU03363.1 4-hydroxythreonine-4-phosphate dehydrogenase [Glycocaulis alkaliphilus]GGB73030.1 4-hydroxythreonine-4-phosphate dehydrogenase [Glycocaulis alkaliphilus]
MPQPQAPLVLTLGDPEGIGPEIALKAWAALRPGGPVFAVAGGLDILSHTARFLDLPAPASITDCTAAHDAFPNALPVLPERPGSPAVASIEDAVSRVRSGEAAGLVTNPVSKAALYAEGFAFPGHTEFLAHLTNDMAMPGERGPVMMLAVPGLRTVLVTIHQALREAITSLSAGRVVHTARITHQALQQDFNIASPRLALAGLNPHAGEGGSMGREEIDILAPALEQLRSEGMDISGPLPPDTMFHAEARERYDAAVCLYHDQGLIPVKTLDFHGGVNVTLGLPIVRTSPDHGTAKDIAGKGIARADSLIAAIQLARQIAQNRNQAR